MMMMMMHGGWVWHGAVTDSSVTDAGLRHLSTLKNLTYLNLDYCDTLNPRRRHSASSEGQLCVTLSSRWAHAWRYPAQGSEAVVVARRQRLLEVFDVVSRHVRHVLPAETLNSLLKLATKLLC
jgi:hypothetical protein